MKGRAFSIWTAAVDLAALGFLTLLLCLPVLTACPAVTALYYSVVKSIRRGRGGPYREYFRSFKENLVQGLGLSVILALFCAAGFFAAVYIVNEPLSEAVDFFYRATFVFTCLVAFMILALACPVLSRFRLKTAQVLLFALRLLVRFPLRTLELLALWAAFGAGCWFFPPLLLIAPGLGTLLASCLIEPSLKHYMPDRSQFDEGTDTWYLE